jgi:hypothetical protein
MHWMCVGIAEDKNKKTSTPWSCYSSVLVFLGSVLDFS